MAGLYPRIQSSILKTIRDPSFEATLPPLADQTWARLLSNSRETARENDRLEFVGDALMYATIGRLLYDQIPNGTPHLYTTVRAALHSNLTFSNIAEKFDILAVSSFVLQGLTNKKFGEVASLNIFKSKTEIKSIADLFETVIGAYYLDNGFESLCAWVKDLYRPLIEAAVRAFHNKTPSQLIRQVADDMTKHKHPPRKAKLAAKNIIRQRRLANATGMGGYKNVPLTRAGPSPAKSYFAQDAIFRRSVVQADSLSTRSVIDLTLESDASDDDSVMQARSHFSTQSRPLRIFATPTPEFKRSPSPVVPSIVHEEAVVVGPLRSLRLGTRSERDDQLWRDGDHRDSSSEGDDHPAELGPLSYPTRAPFNHEIIEL